MSVRVLSRNYKPTYVAGMRYDPKWSYIRQHCVGLWPFWERGSTRVRNWAQPPGTEGTLTKGTATEWRDMTNGPGLHFDGTGYVHTGITQFGTETLRATATQKWTAVVRCRSGVDAVGSIMGIRDASSNTRLLIRFVTAGGAAPAIILGTNTTATTWALDDNTWHTIWVTWTGAVATGYYDAAKGADSLTFTGTTVAGEPLAFGARSLASTPADFFTGDIDFAAILDVPLDPSAIAKWNVDLLAPWRPARRWTGTGITAGTAVLTGTVTA